MVGSTELECLQAQHLIVEAFSLVLFQKNVGLPAFKKFTFHITFGYFNKSTSWGMEMNVFNPSIQKVEAGRSLGIGSQPGLHKKVQDNQCSADTLSHNKNIY